MLIATMRSDFQHRLSEFPILLELTGRSEIKGPDDAEQTLELQLPSAADLRDIIIKPARAAGLSFEVSPEDKRDLARLIEDKARPELMPAVQLLLSELYERKRDGKLTLEDYDILKGVSGVMATLGEEVYATVDDAARESFPRVVRALVTQVSGDVPATTRRIPEDKFVNDSPATQMIAKLKDARLVTSDRGEILFAHDSLLAGWQRLKDQVSEEQRLFGIRARLELLCKDWLTDRTKLLEGFELAEGRELVAKWGESGTGDKQPDLPKYIALSKRRERNRMFGRYVAIAATVLIAVSGVALAFNLKKTLIRAESASLIAKSRGELRDGKITAAIQDANRAFQVLESEESRSALISGMMELSPHLAATFGLPSPAGQTIAWTDHRTIVYSTAQPDSEFRLLDTISHKDNSGSSEWSMPKLTRTGGAQPAAARAIRMLTPDRMLAIFDEGSIADIWRRSSYHLVYRETAGATLRSAHSLDIGRQGTLIAIATFEGVTLIACAAPVPAVPLDCKKVPLPARQGSAVAISPDETRVAIGDETGMVSIYNRHGQPLGEPIKVGDSLSSLGWANSVNWLAASDNAGKITVFNLNSSISVSGSISREPISRLRWSLSGLDLAFVCDVKTVCLWQTTALTNSTPSFAPIKLLEGHVDPISQIAWSPNGNQIASLSDLGIAVWSVAQNTKAGFVFYPEAPAQFSTVASSPNGRFIAAGTKDGTIWIWDSQSQKLKRREMPIALSVAALVWDSRSEQVAASYENEITLIPVEASRPLRRIPTETGIGARIAFIDGDSKIVTPDRDAKQLIQIPIDGSSRTSLPSLTNGEEAWGIIADRAGKKLFVSYHGGKIYSWDLASDFKEPKVFQYDLPEKQDLSGAQSLSLSTNERWLAQSGGDNYVRIYDVVAGKSWRALPMESDEPSAVAFSPNGLKLAALGSKGDLYIWRFLEGATERLAVVNAVPARSLMYGNDRRSSRGSVGWLSWVDDDHIAIAIGGPTIVVIGLDPAKLQRRIEEVADPPLRP